MQATIDLPLIASIRFSKCASDRRRGLVCDGAPHVAFVRVIAKDRSRVCICPLLWRAGEADKAGVRQGIAHVRGEVADEITHRAVKRNF